jgi:hypothetical protein
MSMMVWQRYSRNGSSKKSRRSPVRSSRCYLPGLIRDPGFLAADTIEGTEQAPGFGLRHWASLEPRPVPAALRLRGLAERMAAGDARAAV